VIRSAQFLLGLVVVLGVAAGLRLPGLAGQVRAPDEATVVERATAALAGDLAPPAFDWPPGSSHLLAGAVLVARAVGHHPAGDGLYAFGRVLAAWVAVGTVGLTVALGVAAADDRDRAPLTGLVAGLAVAVSVVGVRLSRQVHPEHVQLALLVASTLAALRGDRTRSAGWMVGAGALAGLAGAVKYLGVAGVAVPLLAVATWPGTGRGRRVAVAAAVGAAAAGAFVAGTLGTVLSPAFPAGLAWQVGHQAGGHLGYDARVPGWVFHLGTSLPGTWGWPLTVAALAGTGLLLARGTRAQRLVAAAAAVLVALVGSTRVAFPHYVLIATPYLAAAAAVALVRLGRWRPARPAGAGRAAGGALAAGLLAASVVPAGLDAARLVRAARAPDTRALAAAEAAGLGAPVWAEAHTGVEGAARHPASLAEDPAAVLACDCVAVLSSYQEDRYRAEPSRWAAHVAGYDALRAAADPLRVVRPSLPLSYRWDLLPAWGLRAVPLTGPAPVVGPTITFLDLRRDA